MDRAHIFRCESAVSSTQDHDVSLELSSLVGYIWHGNSLGSDWRCSFQRLALPPTGYPPMGILNLGCCHSRSYDSQSVVVVVSKSYSDTGPGVRTYVVSWNAST